MHQQVETDAYDSEQEARLYGLVAVLALPPVRGLDGVDRRRKVEVEVAPDIWVVVHGLWLDAKGIVVYYGTNGSRVEWVFRRSEGVPSWRVDHGVDHRITVVFP
jgi:hypothetical protein